MTPRGGSGLSDELLVIECQAGDQAAFERLANRWHSRLLYRAMSLLGDADQAQEVVQEAWLAIARGIRGLNDPARFGAWSYRIIRNKTVDRIRRNQRGRRDRVNSDVSQAPAPSDDHLRDAVQSLRVAIRGLSSEHRRVIELFYLEELPIAEIARLTGVPEGTVKSRLFHARASLKKTLEVQYEQTT